MTKNLPPINQMGVDASERSGLNWAIKAQLKYVYEDLTCYIPTAPRGFGDDNQMPHEWGSMDSYDDTRNALRFAATLMDMALDPFIDFPPDPVEALKAIIIHAECGVCCLAPEIDKAIAPNEEDDIFDILAVTAREMEKAQGLEPNTIFPS